MQKIAFYLILSLIITVNAFAQQSVKEEFLGKKFKDYSELKDLTKVSSAAVNLHYGVAHLRRATSNWLFLSTYINSEKRPDDFELKVIDVVKLPNVVEDSQKIQVKNCQRNGKDDPTLIALVTKEDSKYLTKILQVWKVDKPNGKIISFPTQGVRCLNIR